MSTNHHTGNHAGAGSPFPPSFGANGAGARRDRKVEIYNLRYLPGWRRGRASDPTDSAGVNGAARDRAGGWLLAVASVLLLLLAIAQGYVSFRAQYAFVHAEKGEHTASMLEAAGLDCAAVIFALLALAQARLGRPAVAERVLNLACVIGSLGMNALSADATSAKSIAAWTLPAALYAAASDRLIAVVRRRALSGRVDVDQEGSPLAALRGLALWGLRLGMAPLTTTKGFRAWVLEEAPVAPGRRAIPPVRTLPALPPATDTDAAVGSDAGTDTRSDSAIDAGPDSGSGSGAEKARTLRPSPRNRASATKPATRADKTADKARALLAADPDMSGAELGRRLRVSERTGSRLRARLTTQATSTPATGTQTTSTDTGSPDQVPAVAAAGVEGDEQR